MGAKFTDESFAERLARLEAAREKARLARAALAVSSPPQSARRPSGSRSKVPVAATDAGVAVATDTADALADYLAGAMASADAATIAAALGQVARQRGMAAIARQTGLSRESLYRALSATGNPELGTVLKVLHSLGLRLRVEAAK